MCPSRAHAAQGTFRPPILKTYKRNKDMTIADIRKTEESREGSMNVVHLIKEGSFYHANDWSAWLMTKFPIGEAINKPMVVTAKKTKDDYIHAFVGFPATSIGKYIPNDGSVGFSPVSDSQIDVVFSHVDFGEATMTDIRKQVDEWKGTLPIQESKKHRREDRDIQVQAPRITRICDIIQRIIAVPLEDISPRDAYNILRDLRRDISAIF